MTNQPAPKIFNPAGLFLNDEGDLAFTKSVKEDESFSMTVRKTHPRDPYYLLDTWDSLETKADMIAHINLMIERSREYNLPVSTRLTDHKVLVVEVTKKSPRKIFSSD